MNSVFPILLDCSAVPASVKRSWPRYVPWAFVERWRVQIEESHGRTLEQLARTGGLTPVELWLAAHDRDLREHAATTEHIAARWLIAELEGFSRR